MNSTEESEIKIGKERIQEKSKLLSFYSFFIIIFSEIKLHIVKRLFWGRTNLYKRFVHFSFASLAFLLILSGANNSIFQIRTTSAAFDSISSSNPGDLDLIEQGSDIQMVLLSEGTGNFNILTHKVNEGDTLESIAGEYSITPESLKSSNLEKIDFYDEKLTVGDEILVPEINGVLISMKTDETFTNLISKIEEGNETDIIEINNLDGKDHVFARDTIVLIPDGRIKPPPKPIPDQIYRVPQSSNVFLTNNVDVTALNGIAFQDPLSHPSCSGYGFSRGYSSWHNGIDLAKAGGCEIRAVAAGTVIYSGWEPQGGGYAVTIDHGNGVHTLYFHNSSLYVKKGDWVNAGQEISYMGCTGLCTGTHLHLGLRVNYIYTDASPYIPFRR